MSGIDRLYSSLIDASDDSVLTLGGDEFQIPNKEDFNALMQDSATQDLLHNRLGSEYQDIADMSIDDFRNMLVPTEVETVSTQLEENKIPIKTPENILKEAVTGGVSKTIAGISSGNIEVENEVKEDIGSVERVGYGGKEVIAVYGDEKELNGRSLVRIEEEDGNSYYVDKADLRPSQEESSVDEITRPETLGLPELETADASETRVEHKWFPETEEFEQVPVKKDKPKKDVQYAPVGDGLYLWGTPYKPAEGSTATNVGHTVQKAVHDGLTNLFHLDPKDSAGFLNTREFQSLKEPVIFARNVLSHVMEAPFVMAIDMPTQAINDPVATVNGLLYFFKDEGEILLASIDQHPTQYYYRVIGENNKAIAMRTEARNHIYDTGGVYTYFAISGLVRGGHRSKELIAKKKEFAEIMEVANGGVIKGELSPEAKIAVETLKKDPNLKARANEVLNEQLSLDFIESKELDFKLNKAEASHTAKQVELFSENSKKVGKKKKTLEEMSDAELIDVAETEGLRVHDSGIPRESLIKNIEEVRALQEEVIAGDMLEIAKKEGIEVPQEGISSNDLAVKLLEKRQEKRAVEPAETPSKTKTKTKEVKSTKKAKPVKKQKLVKKPNGEPRVKSKQEIGDGVIDVDVEIKSARDLKPGKYEERIKGETAKRFKNKKQLEKFKEDKVSEYLGDNITIRSGRIKNGDYIAKVFKHTKDQPLPLTATKRPPMRIRPESDEILAKVRNPKDRGFNDRKLVVEEYTKEISEMRRGRDAVTSEMQDLKLKQAVYESEIGQFQKRVDHFNKQADKHANKGNTAKAEEYRRRAVSESSKIQKYIYEHGSGLNNRISSLENAISSYDRALRVSKSQRRYEMTNLELAKDTAGKVSRLVKSERGSFSWEDLSKEDMAIRRELSENISEIWQRSKKGLENMSKKGLKKALESEGVFSKDDISKIIKNYDIIEKDIQFVTFKQLALELDTKARRTSGAVRDTETKTRSSDEYIANIRIEAISGKTPDYVGLAEVELIQSIIDNIGGEGIEGARGTRSVKAIQAGSSAKRVMGQIAKELVDGKSSVENLPERANGAFNMWAGLLEELSKNPDNIALRNLVIESTKQLVSYISEPARTVRSFRDMELGKAREEFIKLKDKLGATDETLAFMDALLSNTEINRHWLHKVAEFARNAKLATGSSLVRSLAGNSISMVDAWVRMPLEIGYDWALSGANYGLYRMTNGLYGSLNKSQMSKLEIGGAWRGFSLGWKEGARLAFDMLLERDNALAKSTYYTRERFHHKEISGVKGKIIRTGTRLQGAIDLLVRTPMTNAYMHRYAVRQAVGEGFKTQAEIVGRASEIIRNGEMKKKYYDMATKHGDYVTYQAELGKVGKFLNRLRTGGDAMSASAQIIVPFFNTSANLIKWSLEHSPLATFTPKFAKAFKDAFTKGETANLSVSMGKMTTGVGALYLLNEIFDLEHEGRIMGDWSDKLPEERAMLANQGFQESSISTNDGHWISYRGFEPYSTFLVMLEELHRGELYNNISKGDAVAVGEDVYNATKALMSSFMDNPFLMGVKNVSKLTDTRSDLINFFVNTVAGGAMPGGVRQLRNIVDSVRRSPVRWRDYEDPYQEVNFWDMVYSQVSHVTPWMKDNNLPALDPFGRIIKEQDPKGALYAWRKTKETLDPVYQEIQKIYFDEGKGFPSAPAWFSTGELNKIKLTNEEHHRLIQYSGEWLYNTIEALMETDVWNMPSYEETAMRLYNKNITQIDVDSQEFIEIAKQSMSNATRRKMINKLREKSFSLFRNLLYADEYNEIKSELGARELSNQFENDEERGTFIESRRKHYNMHEIDDKEYYRRIQSRFNNVSAKNSAIDAVKGLPMFGPNQYNKINP